MLSVIIGTHNPRPWLGRVLEALQTQTLPLDQWELLVVDNLSSEPVSKRFDISWHPKARHINEQQLGTSYARQRGFKEASGDLILFVDDDNILQSDYLETAIKIGNAHPELGTWGSGTIVPEFEVEPHKDLIPYLRFLALRNNKEVYFSNETTLNDATPLGAGLCARQSVVEAYLKFFEESKIKLSDRVGTSLAGGGDNEICYVGCRAGLGMGVFPELKMVHVIPKGRVSEEYLLRLIEETKLTTCILDYKWLNILPTGWGLASKIKTAILRRGFDRKVNFALSRGVASAKKVVRQLA
jgi:glycosyltransferase involved in cell wall biosynthesis